MKKILLAVFMLAVFSVPSFALFGLVNRDDIQLLKNDIKTNSNETNLAKAEFNGKIVGFETRIKKMEVDFNAQLGAFNKIQKAGGDINDTGLMWKIIYGLLCLCTLLVWRWNSAERRADKMQKESAFFLQQLILKANDNKEVQDVLKLKEDFFKSKKLATKVESSVSKAVKAFYGFDKI